MQNRASDFEWRAYRLGGTGEETLLGKRKLLQGKFSQSSYTFYKFWIILTIIIVLIAGYFLINEIVTKLSSYSTGVGLFIGSDTITSFSFIFLLFGCGEMLYGISYTKAKIAQKGFLNFQYSLITSTVVNLGLFIKDDTLKYLGEYYTSVDWILLIVSIVLSITHFVGGLSVVKIFNAEIWQIIGN